jgi:hypothetical protein
MTENSDGILGNLPRSRPGVRSEKRAGGAAAPKPAAAKPKPAAAKPKAAASRPKPAAAKTRAASAKPSPPPPPPKEPDTVERAVQLVGDVAETGIKIAAKVAGGVLRRLPRP